MVFFPLFVSCQNKWQTINYYGISVQIPFDWGSKNIVNHFPENDITEYQISCWSKEKEMSLAIQWVDTELDADLYIESIIKTQKKRFPIFQSFNYNKIVDADFMNKKVKRCHFSKSFNNDDEFEGEYIAYENNEYTFVVMIFGDRKFYKSDDYNAILNSIKSNFSDKEQLKEKTVKTSKTDDNFTRYEFRDYILSVPNTMELRNENSFMSLGKEIMKDKMENIKKIDIEDFNFIFQPRGCDDVTNTEKQRKALALYARVLISYQKGEKGDYMNWNDNTLMTQTEYNELNKSFKNNLLSQSQQMKQMNIELLDIEDIKVGKNVEKYVYIKQSYSRKGLNGNVKVTDYYFHNNSEMVKLTLSYRISENNLWKKDFDKILDTFSFTTKNK